MKNEIISRTLVHSKIYEIFHTLYIVTNVEECTDNYYILKQTITVQYMLVLYVCTIVIMYMECACSKNFVSISHLKWLYTLYIMN